MSKTGIKKLSKLLDNWQADDNGVKKAFIEIYELLKRKEGVTLSFKSRPGISYSLRASVIDSNRNEKLMTLVDIIDDDPQNRWLSVCFYAETITDPREEGDIIPGGLLGEDGYCFDLFENDDMGHYLQDRINEAHEKYI